MPPLQHGMQLMQHNLNGSMISLEPISSVFLIKLLVWKSCLGKQLIHMFVNSFMSKCMWTITKLNYYIEKFLIIIPLNIR